MCLSVFIFFADALAEGVKELPACRGCSMGFDTGTPLGRGKVLVPCVCSWFLGSLAASDLFSYALGHILSIMPDVSTHFLLFVFGDLVSGP